MCPGALAGLDVEVFRVTPVAAGAIFYCREYRGKHTPSAFSRGGTLPVCGGDLVMYARGRRSLRDGWFASVVQVAVQVTADGERVKRLSVRLSSEGEGVSDGMEVFLRSTGGRCAVCMMPSRFDLSWFLLCSGARSTRSLTHVALFCVDSTSESVRVGYSYSWGRKCGFVVEVVVDCFLHVRWWDQRVLRCRLLSSGKGGQTDKTDRKHTPRHKAFELSVCLILFLRSKVLHSDGM